MSDTTTNNAPEPTITIERLRKVFEDCGIAIKKGSSDNTLLGMRFLAAPKLNCWIGIDACGINKPFIIFPPEYRGLIVENESEATHEK